MSLTLVTTCRDNKMINNTNNTIPRNNLWKYEAKLSALKSYVQCELSILHNKIDRFMETCNNTTLNFETKPYEILQDNIKFLQNELLSKNEIIKTLMETQTAILENLPLTKPPQQTERSTAFHNSQQKNVNQLNQNIFFKRQLNQEYNNQSYKQKNHNHYQTREVENDSSKNVDLKRANTVPDNKSYADAVMSHNTKNGITKKVIVFWDSIIRGIRVRDFDQQVKNGYAKFKSFPGCNSKEMLHYIKPTLEASFYDSSILHVGVNDLLNNKSSNSTVNLMSNLVSIINK